MKKRETPRQFAVRRARISPRHLSYLVAGERRAYPDVALRLEKATGINKDVWMFGSRRARQDAWKKFLKSREA